VPAAPVTAGEYKDLSAAHKCPADLESHCGPEVAFGLRRVSQEDQAAVRGAGRDVEPKIEHDGIELEHLVEVAHEGAVHWHSGSCPVQSEVVDAVPEKDVTIMTWEMKKGMTRGIVFVHFVARAGPGVRVLVRVAGDLQHAAQHDPLPHFEGARPGTYTASAAAFPCIRAANPEVTLQRRR
jgi:hypothetical protein